MFVGVSESLSCHAPLLQVRVEVMLGLEGVIVGGARVGALSGYGFVEVAVEIEEPLESVNVTLNEAVPCCVEEQLKRAVKLMPLVELESCEQVPNE